MPFEQRSFGRRLKHARELRSLSQAELGARMGGQTASAVTQWETGASIPKTLNIMELPGILNVSPLWLFFGIGLPEQAGNGTLAPRSRGLGGVRVPKLQAAAAASGLLEAAEAATEFIVAPHADYLPGDVAIEIWDDRNSPEFQRGDEVILRGAIEPRPGDYALVAVGPNDEPEFGQLGVNNDGNWLLHHRNMLWGQRQIRAGSDRIVAVCLKRISVVRQA